MDRLMANFAGTCTSDNKGLLLLLIVQWFQFKIKKYKFLFFFKSLQNSCRTIRAVTMKHMYVEEGGIIIHNVYQTRNTLH